MGSPKPLGSPLSGFREKRFPVPLENETKIPAWGRSVSFPGAPPPAPKRAKKFPAWFRMGSGNPGTIYGQRQNPFPVIRKKYLSLAPSQTVPHRNLWKATLAASRLRHKTKG